MPVSGRRKSRIKTDPDRAPMTVARAFEVLGLPPDADYLEARDGHRRLAFEHHPDRNAASSDSVARFQHIVQAYRVVEGKFRTDAADGGAGAAAGECAACGSYALLREGLDGNRYCRACLTSDRGTHWLPAPMVLVASCGVAVVSLAVAIACLAMYGSTQRPTYVVLALVLALLAVASLLWTCLTASHRAGPPAG